MLSPHWPCVYSRPQAAMPLCTVPGPQCNLTEEKGKYMRETRQGLPPTLKVCAQRRDGEGTRAGCSQSPGVVPRPRELCDTLPPAAACCPAHATQACSEAVAPPETGHTIQKRACGRQRKRASQINTFVNWAPGCGPGWKSRRPAPAETGKNKMANNSLKPSASMAGRKKDASELSKDPGVGNI